MNSPGSPPRIESWWPHLSTDARHIVLQDPQRPLPEPVLSEIHAITGHSVAAGSALTEHDVGFIATQQEPVD